MYNSKVPICCAVKKTAVICLYFLKTRMKNSFITNSKLDIEIINKLFVFKLQ